MDTKEILTLIDNISPHAKEYVEKAFKNNQVDIIYSVSTEENTGVLIAANNEECCIFYAYFINENNIEQILEIIKNKTKEYISKIDSKEICFNVYGNNLKIINEVRKLGFKTDMEGYHLEFVGKELPELNDYNLTVRGFENSMLKEFVDSFDSSYYQLCVDNGWQINSYAMNKNRFNEKLIDLNKDGQVYSFWLKDELVGAYIFENNYITDIVVKPVFQNRGYGSYILAHCIRNMSMNESIRNIRLRVAKSNTGAKKLYERNGFIEIACFAEHTYE
ncbi:N-acetyltransferase [Clostridium sp.]|uniref:GNAT family N-acetyltransferase n=1 Tax=Clostridium sp. TaxID=1506 RepID=UPI003217A89E